MLANVFVFAKLLLAPHQRECIACGSMSQSLTHAHQSFQVLRAACVRLGAAWLADIITLDVDGIDSPVSLACQY